MKERFIEAMGVIRSEVVNLMDLGKSYNDCIRDLQGDASARRVEVSELYKDICGLRDDAVSRDEEIAELRREVSELKARVFREFAELTDQEVGKHLGGGS